MNRSWSTYSEVPSVVFDPVNLGRTIPVALVTGLVLFMINQLDVVIRDPGSLAAWVKTGLCFVVPFCVSNVGVLTASRTEGPRRGRDAASTIGDSKGVDSDQ